MKKYSKYIAAILVCATCMQLSACGISDIPGLSDITGTVDGADQNDSSVDSDTLSKAFSEKLDQGKEIIESAHLRRQLRISMNLLIRQPNLSVKWRKILMQRALSTN